MSGYDRWRDPAEPSWMVEPTTEWHPQFPGQRYPGDIGIQQVPFRSDRSRATATGRAEVVPLVPLDQDGRYRRGPARNDHGGPAGQGWPGRWDEQRSPVDDPYARPSAGWPPPQDRHPVEPPPTGGRRIGPPADQPRPDLRHQPPGWAVDRDRPRDRDREPVGWTVDRDQDRDREPERSGGWHGDRPQTGPDGWVASSRDPRPYPPVSPAPRQEPGWLPEPGEHPPYGGRRHDAPEEPPYGARWHDPPERRGYPVPHRTTRGHDASERPVPRHDAPDHTGPGHDRPDGATDGHRDGWTTHRAPEREPFRPPAAPPPPPADATSPWPDRPATGPDRRWSSEHRSGDDRHARPQWSRDDTRAYPRQPVARDDVSIPPPWSESRSEPVPRARDWFPADDETTQAWSRPGRPGVPETARQQPQDDPGHMRPGSAPEDARSQPWDAGARRWDARPEESTRTRQEWSPEVEDTARIGPARSTARDEQRAPDWERLTAEDLRPVTSPPAEPPIGVPTVAPTPAPATDATGPVPEVGGTAAVPAGDPAASAPVTAPSLGGLRLEFLPSPGAVDAPGQATDDDAPATDAYRRSPDADTGRAEAVPGHDRPAPEAEDAVAGTPTDHAADEAGREGDADLSESTDEEATAGAYPTFDAPETRDDRLGTLVPANGVDGPAPGTTVVEEPTDTVDTGPKPVDHGRPDPVGDDRPTGSAGDADDPTRVLRTGPADGDGDGDGDGDNGREVTSRGLDHEWAPDAPADPVEAEAGTATAEQAAVPETAAAPERVGTPESIGTVEADAGTTPPETAGATEPVTGMAHGVQPMPPATPVSAPPATATDLLMPSSALPTPATPVSAPPVVGALVSAHPLPAVPDAARPTVGTPASPPSPDDPLVSAPPEDAPPLPDAPPPNAAGPDAPLPEATVPDAPPLDATMPDAPPLDAPVLAPPVSPALPATQEPAGDEPTTVDPAVTGTGSTGDLDEAAPVPVKTVPLTSAPGSAAVRPVSASPVDGAEVSPGVSATAPVSAPPGPVSAPPISAVPVSAHRAPDAPVTAAVVSAPPAQVTAPEPLSEATDGTSSSQDVPEPGASSTVRPSSAPVSPPADVPPGPSPQVPVDPQGADAWFRPKQPVSPAPPAPSTPVPDRWRTVVGTPPGPAPDLARPPATPPVSPVSAPPAFRPVVAPAGSSVSAPPERSGSVATNRPASAPPHQPGSPAPVSGPPARPVSPAPGRPVSGPPARPVSGLPHRPVSAPPGQPVSPAPGRPTAAPPGRPVSGPPHRPVSAPSGHSLFAPSVGRARDGDGPASDRTGPFRSDPEQWLAGLRWRLHPDTLREVVDAPDALREARHGLTEKLGHVADNRSRARLLSLRAVTNRLLGDLDDALDDGRLALTYAEATGELRRTALVRARLARVLQWRSEFAEADRLLTEANSPELPDRLRATLHEHLARSAYEQGRLVEACQHFERALDLRRGEDREQIARTEVALDAVLAKAAAEGFGPLPRAREEILRTRRPPVPTLDEEHQLWGYADAEGELVVAAGYAEVQPFREGVAWVRRPDVDGWELIDDTGTTLIDPSYLDVRSFSDGLAWVSQDSSGGWQAVDTAGVVVVPSRFDDVRPFRRGVAAVRVDDAWGAVDRSGRMVVPPRYDGFTTPLADGRYVDGFTDEGLAVVDLGGRRGVLDRSGRVVVAPEHAAVVVHPVAFLVRDPAGRWGALDRRGEPLIEPAHGSRDRLMAEIDHLLADTEPLL
ncbi:WG repeat-containing protein [Micromonospora echinospora]|uniref:WG repeat-containing protein n=1 Tax=Micromonospora echinospora TaxID=1877 RepID=UPI0033C9AAB0